MIYMPTKKSMPAVSQEATVSKHDSWLESTVQPILIECPYCLQEKTKGKAKTWGKFLNQARLIVSDWQISLHVN